MGDQSAPELFSLLGMDQALTADDATNPNAAILRKVVERPEYLVVNCWRSVREVALLLGGSLTQCALADEKGQPRLSVAQVSHFW